MSFATTNGWVPGHVHWSSAPYLAKERHNLFFLEVFRTSVREKDVVPVDPWTHNMLIIQYETVKASFHLYPFVGIWNRLRAPACSPLHWRTEISGPLFHHHDRPFIHSWAVLTLLKDMHFWVASLLVPVPLIDFHLVSRINPSWRPLSRLVNWWTNSTGGFPVSIWKQ